MDIETKDADSALQSFWVGKSRCSINPLYEYLVPFDKKGKSRKAQQSLQGELPGDLLSQKQPQLKQHPVVGTLGRMGLSGRRQRAESEVKRRNKGQTERSFSCHESWTILTLLQQQVILRFSKYSGLWPGKQFWQQSWGKDSWSKQSREDQLLVYTKAWWGLRGSLPPRLGHRWEVSREENLEMTEIWIKGKRQDGPKRQQMRSQVGRQEK